LKRVPKKADTRWTAVHTYKDADGSPSYELRRYTNTKTGAEQRQAREQQASR